MLVCLTLYSSIIPHEKYEFETPIVLNENRPPKIMEKGMNGRN